MDREAWLHFFATGSIVLPLVLYLGTGSLDAVAMSLAALMLVQMFLLAINPDDPIGDKMRADAEKKDLPPE
jgi:hypothetical protein